MKNRGNPRWEMFVGRQMPASARLGLTALGRMQTRKAETWFPSGGRFWGRTPRIRKNRWIKTKIRRPRRAIHTERCRIWGRKPRGRRYSTRAGEPPETDAPKMPPNTTSARSGWYAVRRQLWASPAATKTVKYKTTHPPHHARQLGRFCPEHTARLPTRARRTHPL